MFGLQGRNTEKSGEKKGLGFKTSVALESFSPQALSQAALPPPRPSILSRRFFLLLPMTQCLGQAN